MSATELFDLAVWTKRWAGRVIVLYGLVVLVAYGVGLAYGLGAVSAD
jgi:hypothetical protein